MNILRLFTLLLLFFVALNAKSETGLIPVTEFLYEESEQGAGRLLMRYLVSGKYLRIDYGSDKDDFILFDQKEQSIYSVNHADQTVLFINKHSWSLPEFKFKRSIVIDELKDAPKIGGKNIASFKLMAGEVSCAEVHLLPGMFTEELKVFKQYQNVLSGQQVKLLNNTPLEMQTPCFLVDQIYNTGEYYDQGLPVQEWHRRGYMKILKNYQSKKVNTELFKLPESYKKYSAFTGDS